MALLKCLECGKKVSTEATSCPNCGAPPPKSRKGETITAKEASKMSRKEVNAFIEAGGTIKYNQKKTLLVLGFIIFSVVLIVKFGANTEKDNLENKAVPVAPITPPNQNTKKTTSTKPIEETNKNNFQEQVWVEAGKDAIRLKMKDPNSAEFKDVYFFRGKDGVPVACGKVNSKNSFGGYTGFKYFIAAGNSNLAVTEEEVSDFQVLWKKMCMK